MEVCSGGVEGWRAGGVEVCSGGVEVCSGGVEGWRCAVEGWRVEVCSGGVEGWRCAVEGWRGGGEQWRDYSDGTNLRFPLFISDYL